MSVSTVELRRGADVAEVDLDLDLDVSIVESGDAVSALLGNTDDGCDTQKTGDC
jgi:FxLD family lantipeptide